MESRTYISTRRNRQQSARRRRLSTLLFGLVVFVGACIFLTQTTKAPLSPATLNLAKAAASADDTTPPFSATPAWPDDVIAGAIGIKGKGVIADRQADVQRPTASVAKIITALAVLEKHPLKDAHDLGPRIPLTAKDEALYQSYIAKNGVVVPVKAGGYIHLRHALEAMILPSANNIADTTASWAFGSLENYRHYATTMVKKMGLKATIIGEDASGFSPTTRSTARELIKIGEAALSNPALASIAAEKEFTLPGVGIYKGNRLVRQQGFTGLKPGNTDEAGGTMLFSIPYTYKGEKLVFVGAILGTKSGGTPYNSSVIITNSTKKTLTQTND